LIGGTNQNEHVLMGDVRIMVSDSLSLSLPPDTYSSVIYAVFTAN